MSSLIYFGIPYIIERDAEINSAGQKLIIMNNGTNFIKRIVIYDYLRIAIIVLVLKYHIRVITHIESNFLESLVFYAVPLFMVLSFYLTSKYYLSDNLKINNLFRRLKRLFIPFVFWSLIGFIPHLNLLNIKNIFIQLLTGQVVNLPLYFLVLMIIFSIIFWLFTFIPLRLRLLIYFVLIILMFYFQYSHLNYLFFSPMTETFKKSYGRFIELFPYAVVGLMFGLVKIEEKANWFFLIILSSVAFLLLSIFLIKPPGFSYPGLNLLLGTISIFSVINLVSDINLPVRLENIIVVLGKYTFGVYLLHFTLLEIIVLIFPSIKLFISTYFFPFLIIYAIICYIMCIALDLISNKKLTFLFS